MTTSSPALPIDVDLPVAAVLPALEEALAARGAAVLVAPPGAGKTTLVPLRLIAAPWLAGQQILLLEPRRLAARAAAARMSAMLGENVGETVGYAVRFERQVSQRTRIEVVTEGVLARRLQRDPELEGVGLVIFDELHERSLDTDLTLALVLDARAGLRPDLRLLAMSATLAAEPVAGLLDDAPILRSEGRLHPVETRHRPMAASERLEDAVAAAVEEALSSATGDVLVFLPGAAEIRRAMRALQGHLGPAVLVTPLMGELDRAAQDRALRPAPAGSRKVVLATDIAETSLTIEGVRAVVDSGLARKPRFSPRTGMSRLETVSIALSSADQRRGRAGRQGPGLCLRLWAEARERAMPAFAPPEIADADLAGLALDLAQWGIADAGALRWLTPPPAAALRQARRTLQELGALDAAERITAQGRRMAALPLHPRLAAMIVAAEPAAAPTALVLAALLSGRDPWRERRETDLAARLRWWRAGEGEPQALREVERVRAQLRRLAAVADGEVRPELTGPLLALAFPDRIAQPRGEGRGTLRLANGRGAALDPADPLGRAELLVVVELDDKGADPRVYTAAALDRASLERVAAARIVTATEVAWDDATEGLLVQEVTRLGALILKSRPAARPDAAAAEAAILGAIRRHGPGWLPWSEAATALRARLDFLHRHAPERFPAVDDAALLADLEGWLSPWLGGVTRRRDLERVDLQAALLGRLEPDVQRGAREAAPATFRTPLGHERPIDYAREPPTVSVRLQELLGLDRHPTVLGGRVPLVLELLSPASRPIQATRDLPAFWRGSYAEVRKELRGRYPKHPWPEDPLEAAPTLKSKRRS